MWRTTGDVKWRERGYEIFRSINQNTRTQYGFTSVSNVDGEWTRQLDDMPRSVDFVESAWLSLTLYHLAYCSYFLAETLKYLYLLFDDVNSFSLDRWVFNTEAHPLPIFSWTEKEKVAFNITL